MHFTKLKLKPVIFTAKKPFSEKSEGLQQRFLKGHRGSSKVPGVQTPEGPKGPKRIPKGYQKISKIFKDLKRPKRIKTSTLFF